MLSSSSGGPSDPVLAEDVLGRHTDPTCSAPPPTVGLGADDGWAWTLSCRTTWPSRQLSSAGPIGQMLHGVSTLGLGQAWAGHRLPVPQSAAPSSRESGFISSLPGTAFPVLWQLAGVLFPVASGTRRLLALPGRLCGCHWEAGTGPGQGGGGASAWGQQQAETFLHLPWCPAYHTPALWLLPSTLPCLYLPVAVLVRAKAATSGKGSGVQWTPAPGHVRLALCWLLAQPAYTVCSGHLHLGPGPLTTWPVG